MKNGQPKSQSFKKLLGGSLCLDFVNTVDWRGRPEPEETLHTYHDLIRWCRYVNILKQKDAETLSYQAKKYPSEARKALASAKNMREILYSILFSIADEKAPEHTDLADFNAYLSRAGVQSKIVWMEERFSWQPDDNKTALDWMIYPIIRSAAELLVSDDVKKVKGCGDRECGWLFLDTSRNQSRRWCDMKDCGNRAKARRFYRRKKGES